MTGIGFAALLAKTKSRKQKKVSFASPSQNPRVEDDHGPAGGEQGTSSAPKKRNRTQSPLDAIPIDLDPPQKRREASRRSSLDLDDLKDVDFERLKADPLLFVAEIAQAASQKLARYKSEEAGRQAGMRLLHRNLWLEGDLLDKTDKYKSALGHITDLRAELESTKKKLEDAEVALQPTKDALGSVTAERDAAMTARIDAEAKLATANASLAERSNQVIQLEERVVGLEENLRVVGGERDQARSELEALEDMTISIASGRFDEAVAQIRYCHPSLEINPEIVNNDHFLRNGQIVRLAEKDEDGNVIQEETVVYSRPE